MKWTKQNALCEDSVLPVYQLQLLTAWLNELQLKNSFFKSNGKAIPLQVWTGPEVSRRLRLPDLKTIGT
jgi:hypothetical protein